MEDYKDYIEDTVRMSSPLYHQAYPALLAMAAYVYSCDKDDEFNKFIDGYANNTYEFTTNQKVNYNQMKEAFQEWLKTKEVAA